MGKSLIININDDNLGYGEFFHHHTLILKTMNKLLVFLAFLFACNTSKQDKLYDKITFLETTEYIELTLDSLTKPTTTCLQYDISHDEMLYWFNESTNSIYKFNLSTGYSNIIRISKEGPEGVGIINGFYVVNPNEIIITTNGLAGAYVIDSTARLKRKILFSNKKQNFKGGYSAPYNRNELFKKTVKVNNMIYFPQKVTAYWPSLKNEELNDFSIELAFNLETEALEKKPVHFPSDYWKFGFTGLYFSREVDINNRFIYSFTNDHNIYVYDSDNWSCNKINAKSRYIDELGYEKKNGTIEEHVKSEIKNPRYEAIRYDPFHDLYYRIVYHGDEIYEFTNWSLLSKNKKRYSILILDSSFKIVGEFLLPSAKYMVPNLFITPKGIYISNANYNNPDFDESVVKFYLFKPLFKDG